jgi:hypothetical protein
MTATDRATGKISMWRKQKARSRLGRSDAFMTHAPTARDLPGRRRRAAGGDYSNARSAWPTPRSVLPLLKDQGGRMSSHAWRESAKGCRPATKIGKASALFTRSLKYTGFP